MRKLLTITALVCSALIVWAVTADANAATIPADFQCRNIGGCVARRPVDGVLTDFNFRKGDLVSTDDGWIVDPDDGWRKVRSNPPPQQDCMRCHL